MRSSVISLIFSGMMTVAFASPAALKFVARDIDPACLNCTGVVSTDPQYCCGNVLLGPATLPSNPPVSVLVNGYKRFGSLTAGQFLNKTEWFDKTSMRYIYPLNDGFQIDMYGHPIEKNQTLSVGMELDRFGLETGRFLSPAGALYSQRAIPSFNLNTNAAHPDHPNNYYRYKVNITFTVLSGPIAAWFAQPGNGTQYLIPNNKTVNDLVKGKFLVPVNTAV